MLDQEGNASARMDEVQKRLEMRDPEVVRLNAEAMDQIQKLVTTQYSSLIIEEPEQNLFPSSQHDLVYDLIRMLKANDRKNHLTLTTHSPYILYAINNCVLGYLVRNQIPAEQLAQLKCRDSLIDPALVSVYQITTEGNLQKIQQEDGLIGKNYFDDTMKEIMDDFYSLIDYYND